MENVVRFYDNLENVSVIWYNVVYSRLVYFVVIWYIFPVLVCLDQEKSGNPADYLLRGNF
jgi:hypothetical protein